MRILEVDSRMDSRNAVLAGGRPPMVALVIKVGQLLSIRNTNQKLNKIDDLPISLTDLLFLSLQ